jgi:hypothetical protein
VAGAVDLLDAEPSHHLNEAGLDGLLRASAERATFGQLISGSAAEGVADDPAPQRPRHPGSRVRLGDPTEFDDRGRRRVTGTDHDGVPAGERLGLLEVSGESPMSVGETGTRKLDGLLRSLCRLG